LTINDSSASYAIICYNIRTYRSAGVIAVIGGKHRAEVELKKFEDAQNSSDRHEGWRYLIDKTDLKAGTDPAEATLHRQSGIGKTRIKSSAGDRHFELFFATSSEMKRDCRANRYANNICKASTRNIPARLFERTKCSDLRGSTWDACVRSGAGFSS
jgi:hypothetical protein